MRGTAIITRDSISLENVIMLPSGRAIAVKFREIWIINIYAPSGTAWKQDRENFYNNEVLYIIATAGEHIFLGGDFNCIFNPTDATGGYNYSRELQELIQGLSIIDIWQTNTDRRGYTHISAYGASRLESTYVTKELNSRKQGVEVAAAAFTDQLAVCLRPSSELPIMRTGRGLWKMDNDILTAITGWNKMQTLWEELQRQKRHYPDTAMWWDRCCKTKIKRFFQHEQAERRKEQRMMENHLYDVYMMYFNVTPPLKTSALNETV